MQTINVVFDTIDLIAHRLPGLDQLVVQLILLGLALFGAYTLFKHHPH